MMVPNWKWFSLAMVLLAIWWMIGSKVGFIAVLLVVVTNLVSMLAGKAGSTTSKMDVSGGATFMLMFVLVLVGIVVLALNRLG